MVISAFHHGLISSLVLQLKTDLAPISLYDIARLGISPSVTAGVPIRDVDAKLVTSINDCPSSCVIVPLLIS
jgi:hypothetical protein